MKITARLINKKEPILIIKKTPNLKLNEKYLIKFLDIKQDIEIERIIEKFENEYYQIKIGTKVKGCLKLKYQTDYKIELEEK